MNKLFLHLFNITSTFLPYTRLFAFKRALLCLSGISIGNNVKVNGLTRFVGEGQVVIGDNSWIGLNNYFFMTTLASIYIGNNCDVGPDVSFIPGSHIIGDENRRAGQPTASDIVVGDGCWIGARSTILGGVTIGDGSIVAAGSLVRDDVPSNCLVVGVPATVRKILSDA